MGDAMLLAAAAILVMAGGMLIGRGLNRILGPAPEVPIVPPGRHAMWIDRRTGKLQVKPRMPAPPPDTGRDTG